MNRRATAGPRITTIASRPFDLEQRESSLKRNAEIGAQFGDDRRGGYASQFEQTPIADGVVFQPVADEGVAGLWACPANARAGKAILYIHGGGYRLGGVDCYRGLTSQLAARTRCATFSIDYPLAPEHPFPAAYEAAMRARAWLVRQDGVNEFALAGDSAGGGLALTLLAAGPQPRSTVVFSPWTDLALTGASYHDRHLFDPVFKPKVIAGLATAYLGDANPRDPRASPLYSTPQPCSSLLIQVGTDELLLDDSRRFAALAAGIGMTVELQIFEKMFHNFQAACGRMDIADHALEAAASFIDHAWRTRT